MAAGEIGKTLKRLGSPEKALILSVLLSAGLPQPASTCSTFYIGQGSQPIFGKNYDWSVDDGLVIVNKRNVTKMAMSSVPAARWTSKYGSVTFNQYGRELPSGGMNEVGLVIELMWLDATEYPRPDERPAVGNLQWIQFQLDNASTVDEVIASDSRIRIDDGGASKIHYLVSDAAGHCASVEFIDGKMVCYKNEEMPAKVLTNSTYDESVANLEKNVGGREVIGKNSLDRFVTAAEMVADYDPKRAPPVVDYGFNVLATVAQGEYTMWSIVYDIENARIYFRTHAVPQRRFVDLESMDFSCDTPVRVLDINADLSGDVTKHFVDYTRKTNRKLIDRAFGETPFLKKVPRSALDRLSRYPDNTLCDPEAAAR